MFDVTRDSSRKTFCYLARAIPCALDFVMLYVRGVSQTQAKLGKTFCSSWLALSNGMKCEDRAGRAVHVQADWKLCTCTARRGRIFRFATRQTRDQLNETRPTIPNLPGCKKKVQTEICGAKIIHYPVNSCSTPKIYGTGRVSPILGSLLLVARSTKVSPRFALLEERKARLAAQRDHE